MSVPLLDLSAEIESLRGELDEAIGRVLDSGQFILGPEVEGFEQAAANYLGVDYAIGVNSGTDALVIGLRALGIKPGDEVITTPFTFFATAEAISQVGATPVFVDIAPESFNIDPERIEAAITEKTSAILPVHLFGAPAAMTRIRAIADRHDLKVLEDCAQSFGATYEGACPGCDSTACEERCQERLQGRKCGTIGEVGAFSFFPTKNLGAYGDGGLITTNDPKVDEVVRMLRKHGGKNKYHNEVLGYNSRLDAMQAAILRVKLSHIDEYNERRRRAAIRYNELLSDVDGLGTPTLQDGHVVHQYTIRVTGGRRDAVKQALLDKGIGCKVYYPVPCHQLPVYDEFEVELPEAERAADEVLSLPMFPHLTELQQTHVVNCLRESLGSQSRTVALG
jgi:dTDP-4-amino-4,6-dideoxygalactose transaminase